MLFYMSVHKNYHFAGGQSVATTSEDPKARAASHVKPGDPTGWSLATVDNLRI